MNDLESFVDAMIPATKTAGSDLDGLSLYELEALIGFDVDKLAYVSSCLSASSNPDWLGQFDGTPLAAKAIQLCEQELEIEQERMQNRLDREAASKDDADTWTRSDMLRLQKDMLSLELHKSKQLMGKDPTMPAMPAPAPEKAASDIQITGEINNGETEAPSWPRAALGVDSADRRATAEEVTAQKDLHSPAALVPYRGTKTSGIATYIGSTVGKALSSGAINNNVGKGLSLAHNVGARLGGKTIESAVGRGLGAGALGLGAVGTAAVAGTRKTSGKKTAFVALPLLAAGAVLGARGIREILNKKEEEGKKKGKKEEKGRRGFTLKLSNAVTSAGGLLARRAMPMLNRAVPTAAEGALGHAMAHGAAKRVPISSVASAGRAVPPPIPAAAKAQGGLFGSAKLDFAGTAPGPAKNLKAMGPSQQTDVSRRSFDTWARHQSKTAARRVLRNHKIAMRLREMV